MAEFDRGYGPTEAEFTRITNRNVTNSSEFERQRARAQEVIDALCGNWTPFHIDERQIDIDSVGSTSIVSSHLDIDKDDYYNNLELRVVQGDGKGFRGYISAFDSSTNTATIVTVSDDVVLADVSPGDTAILRQIAQFPRLEDMDVTGRPRLPESLSRMVAYVLEYWVNLEEQEGWNADQVANLQTDLIQEGLGDWQATYKAGRNPVLLMIGHKAYELGMRTGLFRRTARMVRFSSQPIRRRFI